MQEPIERSQYSNEKKKKKRKILANRNAHERPVYPVLQQALGQATDGQSVQMDVKQIIVSWVRGFDDTLDIVMFYLAGSKAWEREPSS